MKMGREMSCPHCKGTGKVRPKAMHSDEQRGLYWATLHAYGDKCGYSRKESDLMLHNAVLCEAYGIKRYANYRGMLWPVPRERSAKQSTEKYSTLIDTLQRMIDEDALEVS